MHYNVLKMHYGHDFHIKCYLKGYITCLILSIKSCIRGQPESDMEHQQLTFYANTGSLTVCSVAFPFLQKLCMFTHHLRITNKLILTLLSVHLSPTSLLKTEKNVVTIIN